MLRRGHPGGARGRSHCRPLRFKNLARQHQSMFPSLEVDVEGQLKRLKVEQGRWRAGGGKGGGGGGRGRGRAGGWAGGAWRGGGSMAGEGATGCSGVGGVAWHGGGRGRAQRGGGRGAAGRPHQGTAALPDAQAALRERTVPGTAVGWLALLGTTGPLCKPRPGRAGRFPRPPGQGTFPRTGWGKRLSLFYLG